MSFLTIIPVIMGLIAQAPQFLAIFDVIGKLITQVVSLLPGSAQAAKPLDVIWLQTSLKAAGFDPGAIDGKFGPATQIATKAYQTARALVADGWPGVATTAKLLAEPKK
jgi:hypothetical protein